ncbi:MAG TPA: hypothetical protein VLI55_02700 [Bryobacteraceae bacterium]|nr:hypothetical protein [Bryobacteraceae bacterium]
MIPRRTLLDLTRRQWTALIAAAPLAAQVTSKIPPQGAPAPSPPSANPQQALQKAYADVRALSDRLSKMEVPMNVEPAFAFRP